MSGKKFYTDVIGKMCAKDVNAPHTWMLRTYPWGKIVGAVEKDNSICITVLCPLTGRMAEMWLTHVVMNPSREYLDQFEEERIEAQRQAGTARQVPAAPREEK